MTINLPELPKNTPTVLALDMGTRNCAISCVGAAKQPLLIANRMVDNPIRGLTTALPEKTMLFIEEIDQWVQAYNPSKIVVERFQSRGLMGTTVEEISLMIGALTCFYGTRIPVEAITAATWKNEWHRNFTGYALKDLYRVCRTPDHLLDATLIGIWAQQKINGVVYEYDVGQLLEGVAETTLSPTINRKLTLEDIL